MDKRCRSRSAIFTRCRDVLDKGYTGREVRYALMRVHYRAPLNFTWEGMEEARQALARIDDWLRRDCAKLAANERIVNANADANRVQQFDEALDDDLNISAALGFLFEIDSRNESRDGSTASSTTASASAWLNWWERRRQRAQSRDRSRRQATCQPDEIACNWWKQRDASEACKRLAEK